ncbi:MAG: hypothetical protein NTZ21_12410 [Actinobacteria bacterium]|nr:hypothetical protein [Actinomycetota bacterium]
MELRSAARADTQIYAIGLDVGGMALEVAQRGFSTMLSNRMAQLGRWSFDGVRPAIRLADDLVVHLLERERSSRFERAVIGIAAPAWLGIHERTQLAEVVDPRQRHTLVACSTTMAGVIGTNLAGEEPLQRELVLCLDLEVGFSASIVEIGEASIREWCSVGLSPQLLRGETVGLGIVPGTRQRDRALAVLHGEAVELGCADVGRVVALGEEPVDDLVRLLAQADPVWAERPLEAVRGRGPVARGAAFLADPRGGLEMFDVATIAWSGTPDAGDEPDPLSLNWHVSGALGKRLGVLMDDRDGRPVVHPVVERGSSVPSIHEQLFDLGPDDGSDVFLDLYEQHGVTPSDDPVDHRVVATAHLRPDAMRRSEVTVTFEHGVDGRFAVGPTSMWTLVWHSAEVDVVGVRRLQVEPDERRTDDGRADRQERSTVRPLIASWAVSPTVADITATSAAPVPPPDEAEPADPLAEIAPLEETLSLEETVSLEEAADPAPAAGPEVVPDRPSPVPAPSTPSSALTARDQQPVAPLPPTPAIAAALQRCERLLSYEVGQMVAIRSVFALLDCADDADADLITSSADRLEGSMARRDDDLAVAIRLAIAAIRRSLAGGSDDWYFGGTLADVDAELGRVVEHLMVVVGLVSAAEQRRLVHDAQLLGVGPERARAMVRELVLRAQAERVQAALQHEDGAVRTVHLHPGLGRFVLDGGADGRSDVMARDAVRMRVLLDVR